MTNEPTETQDERPGEQGPAAEAGIVDQQDAVLHEMQDDDESTGD